MTSGHGSIPSVRGIADPSKRLLRDLVDRANDVFIVVDRYGVVEFVNATYCRITGFERAEVETERVAALFEVNASRNAQELLSSALQPGGPASVGLLLRKKSGEAVDVAFRPVVERAADGTMARMILVGQSPYLFGELAERFNSLNRDLRTYSADLERLNAELEDRIRERTARVAALLEVSASLNAELQLDALFELILRQAIETIPGAEAGVLLLYEPQIDKLVVQAATTYDDPQLVRDLQRELSRVHPQSIFSDHNVHVWSGETRAKTGQMRLLLRNVDQYRIRSAISAPIATPSERLGVLLLHNFGAPGAFSDEDVQLAASLAGSAAVAIINARLYEERNQQNERLELVNRLSAAVRDSADLDHILGLAVAGLGHVLGASRVVIALHDDNATAARYAAEYAEPGLKQAGDRPATLLGTPLLREVIGFRELRAIRQVRDDPRLAEAAPALAGLGVESLIAAPLAVRERFIGTIEIHQCDRVRRWLPAETGLVEGVAKQVATAIHQGRLHARLRDTVRELEALHRASGLLVDTSDLDGLLAQILEAVHEAFGVPRSAILLVDPRSAELFMTTGRGHDGLSRLPIDGPGIVAAVARTRKAVNAADVSLNEHYRETWADCRSELALPLLIDHEVVGVLDLQSDRPAAFSERDVRVLSSFAERAAHAVRQAQLYRELQSSAEETAALYECIAAVAAARDLETTLDTICNVVHEKLGWGVVVLSLVDETGYYTHPTAVAGLDAEDTARLLRAPLTPVDEVEALGERFRFSRSLYFDHRIDPHWHERVASYQFVRNVESEDPEAWHPDDALVVPIVLDYVAIGRISVDQPADGKRPTLRKVRQLELFADQAAVAIRQAQLYREAQQRSDREQLINRITTAIRSSLDLDQILQTTVDQLGSALGASRCWLVLVSDPDTESLPPTYQYCDPSLGGTRVEGFEIPIASTPRIRHLLEHSGPTTKAPGSTGDLLTPDVEAKTRDLGIKAMMGYGIRDIDGPIGFFSIHQCDRKRTWTQWELDLLRDVSDQVAIAVRQARLFGQVAQGKRAWEATFDAMSDAVFIFDADGRLTRANASAARMEGREFRELAGTPCCEILAHAEHDECMVRRAMKERCRLTHEWSVAERSYSITVDPMHSAAGEVTGAVAVVRDLSDLRRAERASERQQRLLSQLMENAYDLMALVDLDGIVVWHNSAFRAVVGEPAAGLNGSYFLDLLATDHRDAGWAMLARAAAGEAQIGEAALVALSGERRDVTLTEAPVYDAGAVTGVLVIGRDITDQKRAAEKVEEAEKLRALGQLAAGVAHDFNNMLAAILGRAQLLRRATDEEAVQRGLDVIETAALDGANTVKRIQNFAHQRLDADLEEVDVSELVRDAVEITRTRWKNDAQSRGISYEIRVEAPSPALVAGDGSELREVFVNLIINALDAMEHGGAIRVSVNSEGGVVTVRFEDSGPGMSDDVRRRVFEPFFTTKGDRGVGMGLAVSYGIVRRHNGRIDVRSAPGQGATFSVCLPAAEPGGARAPLPEVARARRARLLVVDDEKQVRDVLVELLQLQGHLVTAAAGGEEALEKLRAEDFDVVFTDLSMPGMDGWAVARAVRQIRPSCRVVMATGYAATIEPADAADVDLVVAKPFDVEEIEAGLAGLLR
jgi:PAS domain S-box-containing protein